MTKITGTASDDSLTGSATADTINLTAGGHDTAAGRDGDDTFSLGAAFDTADRLNGRGGRDTLVLRGDYSAGLQITDAMMNNFEVLSLAGGYSYDLTLSDDLLAAAHELEIDVRGSGIVDDSAEANGMVNFHLYADHTTVIGGPGRNTTYVHTSDVDDIHILDGRGGFDQVGYLKAVRQSFDGDMLQGLERVAFDGTSKVTFDDSVLTTGSMDVYGEQLIFDGSAETTGSFTIVALKGGSRLEGGAKADRIITGDGYGGVVTLIGHGGGDDLFHDKATQFDVHKTPVQCTFIYETVHDSNQEHPDKIWGLASGDTIDLHRIDADETAAGNQAFFVAAQFHGKAGELVVSYDHQPDVTTFSGDVDGDGAADLVITATGDQSGFTGFVF